jgi:co-chaperonin GroES (HSP10)
VEALRRVLEERGVLPQGGGGVATASTATTAAAAAAVTAVDRSHFLDALAVTKPSVGAGDAARYERWAVEFGSM